MKIVIAPNEDYSVKTEALNKKVFLAGGITNCPDWQSELIKLIKNKTYERLIDPIGEYFPLTLYNPRRENFPIDDPTAAEQQIVWEYKHLKEADIIVFWFSRGSDNPIVLYELGMWGNSGYRNTIIGVDPEYSRKQDVFIQTWLAKHSIDIFDNLDDIATNLIIDIKR